MDFSGALAYLSEQNATCVLDELSDGGKGLSSHWAELYHGSLSGIITQLAMLVFGVLLNFQILLLAIFKRLYTHSTFLLLLNLVIVDICICLIPITFNISIGFAGGYSFGNSDYVRCQVCKIAAVFVMLKLLSSFNLALLSMDRFTFFFMPFNKETNHAIMAKYKLTILGLAGAWLLSAGLVVPPLVGYGDVVFFVPCGLVFLTTSHVNRSGPFLIAAGICGLMVVVIIVASNAWILFNIMNVVKEMKRVVHPEHAEGGEESTNDPTTNEANKIAAKREIRLYLVFVCILLVDLSTYFVAVLTALIIITFDNVTTFRLLGLALIAVLSQTIMHPLTETYLIPEFREGFLHLYKRFLSRKDMSRVEGPVHYRRVFWLWWENLWVRALESKLAKCNGQL